MSMLRPSLLVKHQRRERAYSNDWEKRTSRKNLADADTDDLDLDYLSSRPVSRQDFERKSTGFSRSRSRTGYRSNGPMETLDRRISASTDNLDTLKREKRANRMWTSNGAADKVSSEGLSRPRSVSSRKEPKSAVDHEDFTFRINGEKMSKNRYFFGGELKSALKNGHQNAKKRQQQQQQQQEQSKDRGSGRKTALDIFLEDKGPYSRKLYGPPPGSSDDHDSSNGKSAAGRKRARSQEVLLNEVSLFC